MTGEAASVRTLKSLPTLRFPSVKFSPWPPVHVARESELRAGSSLEPLQGRQVEASGCHGVVANSWGAWWVRYKGFGSLASRGCLGRGACGQGEGRVGQRGLHRGDGQPGRRAWSWGTGLAGLSGCCPVPGMGQWGVPVSAEKGGQATKDGESGYTALSGVSVLRRLTRRCLGALPGGGWRQRGTGQVRRDRMGCQHLYQSKKCK